MIPLPMGFALLTPVIDKPYLAFADENTGENANINEI
jgi:hypothetical protein